MMFYICQGVNKERNYNLAFTFWVQVLNAAACNWHISQTLEQFIKFSRSERNYWEETWESKIIKNFKELWE